MATATTLDTKFWAQFAKSFWEKKSVVYKNVRSKHLRLGPVEVFDLLVKFSDRCRKLGTCKGLKFYVDGQIQFDQETIDFLPQKTDQSLVGYHKRISQIFGVYCLVCDELLQVSGPELDPLVQLTHELYKHVGFPNRFSEMGLYLGNYQKTPFGVHVDGCGVLSFPIVGTKKFRIWKPEFVAKNPDLIEAFEYSRFKKDSQLLRAKPGDMTYWPSNAWHIAESDGSFSATWSLGVWVDRTHLDFVTEALRDHLETRIGESGSSKTVDFQKLYSADGQVQNLPKIFRQTLESLKKMSNVELENIFFKAWSQHISKHGLKTDRKGMTKVDSMSKLSLRSPSSPVLWVRKEGGSAVLYSFAGVTTSANSSAGLLKMIQKLNKGQSICVKDDLDSKNKSADLKCLQNLADAGAFVSLRLKKNVTGKSTQ